MAEKYSIKNLSDIIALTPDQRARCVVDLLTFCDFHDKFKAENITSITVLQQFIWVDDERIGQLSGGVFQDPDGAEIGRIGF